MKEKMLVRPVFCDTCGGTLKYGQDGKRAVCPFCGNTYNFEDGKGEALSLALSRANSYRLNCDFDEAVREYTLITERCPEDAEAWWGLALSKYGIEYVPDEASGKLAPTFHCCPSASFTEDESYLNAIKYAGADTAEAYRAKAEQIESIRQAICSRMAAGRTCDVFLCYRACGADGAPSEESTIARTIREELSRRGISVFSYEEQTKGLEFAAREQLIYAALHTCRFFILIACSTENIAYPAVKNVWSRFRERAYEERLSAAYCAVFKNISPAELPSFLRVQGIDLAKYPAGGYEIEIADNLSARFSAAMPHRIRTATKDDGEKIYTVLAEGRAALAREDYVGAAVAFSRAIELDGDNGEAWLGALLAELEIKEIKNERKLAVDIINKLWASGSSVAECRERLARNESILFTLSSPYYKNAVKYTTAGMARTLTAAKSRVMDIADKCTASLKLSLGQCMARENSKDEFFEGASRSQGGYNYSSEYGRTGSSSYGRTSSSGSAASFIGGAMAGGLLGLLLGGRRNRPPHYGFTSPHRPKRPPRNFRPHGSHGPRGLW